MYTDKIENYQADCKVLLGKYENFSDYIKNFALLQKPNTVGLDIGVGPKGQNGKFFKGNSKQIKLDGCDAEQAVLDSLDPLEYDRKFLCIFGKDYLPYEDKSRDFVTCSCVIQHLNNFVELSYGFSEVSRILKCGGMFYLMFKVGTNDTDLIHTNSYYGQERKFRVFEPESVIKLGRKHNLVCFSRDLLLDDNYIPYSCLIFSKYDILPDF